jgi:NAD-dependent dihydropyrimidine dehydrogenase PreA subunit
MGCPLKYLRNVVSLHIDSALCTGCGLCVEVCPRGVLLMEGGLARITDRDLCIECGACALNCAFDAIRAGRGVGCAAAVIGSMRRGSEPECGCSCSDEEIDSCC